MRSARVIAALAILTAFGTVGIGLSAGEARFDAAGIDGHPELGIPPAFRVGADSGGAGSASRNIVDSKGTRTLPLPSPSLLPSIQDSTCTSVVGICACVANQSTYCNASECAATCLKTN